MQAPNRLGAALNYFAEAYRYAAHTRKADPQRRNIGFRLLDAMTTTPRYQQPDSVTTDQAVKQAVCSAWVYSGIKTIADRVAAADARPNMKRRVGDEVRDQPNHPFSALLDQPNSLMTWEFVARYTTWWAYLLGNAYLFIATPEPGAGTPEELWPLPADAVSPNPKSMRISRLTGKPCIDYEYVLDGKTYTLPGENVIHIRFPNPFDYWFGLSPLSALIDAVRTDRYQQQYLQGFFGKDNAIPTAIISVPAETNDIDFETIKEQIRDQFGSGRRSAITRAGDLSVQTITQTLQQMEIINSRKFSREEINHVLGIPEGLINGSTSADSRLATEITFARITIQPFLDLVAAELTANLAPYYGPGYVVKAPSVIPQDRSLALQEYEKYSQDRSINENRQVLHLPPLDMPGIMATINAARSSGGLEEITTPLDSAILDLMLNIPIRLIAVLSSNTFANASATGLRPGQTDAGGNEVLDPIEQQIENMQQMQDAFGDQPAPAEGDAAPTDQPKKPAFANVEKPPKTPSMIGAGGGAREVQVNAGKAYLWHAAKIGQQAELNRWKKVAIKMIRSGDDPSSYEFETLVLPQSLLSGIRKQLAKADEMKCGMVFDTWMETIQVMEEWQ